MGWYNSSWTYRQKITVDATKVDEVFSLLPIYTSRLNIDFFDRAKAGAADVRITQADGTTEIARYVVAHDATAHTGLILANVLSDVSISTNTDYYIYYGNSAASDYATSATYGRDAVFAEYEGAYTPGMTVSDLTGAGRDLTAVGTPTTAASTYEGITAAVYNGTTQGHYYTGVSVMDWPITIEALAYIGNTTSNRPAVALVSTASNSPQAYVGFAQTADKISMTVHGDSGSTSTAETSTTYVANTYYHMMGTRDANTGTSTAYKNGGSSGTETTTITTPTFNTTSIGYLKLATPTSYLAGRVAVALLSNTVRSANYANTMYNAWSTSGFFTAGAIETETGGTTGWVLFQTAATTTASGTLVDWTSVNNALSVNADFSSCALDPSANYESETLKLTNPAYGITIPSGETTYSAKFRVKHSKSSGGSRVVEDLNVQFIDNTGSLVGSNLAAVAANWPLAATEVDYTVSGVSLTDSKFTSSSGLAFSATATNSASAVTAQMITAWMRVDWDTPASGNTGTGALTSAAGTVSGAGAVGKTGTGALVAAAATVSGAGASGKTGTGALSAPVALLSGVGSQTVSGSGAILSPAATVYGEGTGTMPVTGTGAIEAPMPSVSGIGTIESGDQTLVGALTAQVPIIAGTAITGRTGTAALVAPKPVIAGSGKSTVSGTGALVAPSAYAISGIGLNSPPSIVGTSGLVGTVPIISGTGFVVDGGEATVDSIDWYLTGADAVGRSQRSQAASLGGFRSSIRVKSMVWDCDQPMVGVEILEIGALNGVGSGSLEAVTSDSIRWTPPNGRAGTAVDLVSGNEATLFGFESGAWIKVRRHSTIPMVGIHTVQCLDVYNNAIAFDNVVSADAVAGSVKYRAIIGRNPYSGPAVNMAIWLDAAANDNIEIGYEAAVAGEIQTIADEDTAPTGITWVNGVTDTTGILIPSVPAGESFGIWIKRTIAADSDPTPRLLNHIHVKFSDLTGTDHYDDLRGKYRIARTDFVTYGLWVGQDEQPDFSLAANEEFTSLPHTTTLTLDASHIYYATLRQRNKWGLWSQNTESTTLPLDAAGEQTFVKPSAPNTVAITQTGSANYPVISARYEPAFDDDHRGDIFVVWYTRDDSAPDPTDTPSGYKTMNGRVGIETLKFTASGADFIDETPVKALVRTRRLAIGSGTAFSPDTTQLPASGAGTIVVDSELAGWDSAGFMKITTFSGALQEIVEYDSLVVGAGISTFNILSGGRAQWGTTAAATATNTVIYPVYAVDSDNTTATEYTIDGIAPGRPWGELLFGNEAAQEQTPIAGPDGVTVEYIDEPNNIYLLLGEGWCELWMDTVLVWKVFQDGNTTDQNAVYVPYEWDLVAGSVSGASSGVFDATDADNLYIVAGSSRKVHINASAMTITMPSLSSLGNLPEVAPAYSTWEQYAGSLLQSWDPQRSDYRPYAQITTDGELAMQWTIDNSLTQAEIVAL